MQAGGRGFEGVVWFWASLASAGNSVYGKAPASPPAKKKTIPERYAREWLFLGLVT